MYDKLLKVQKEINPIQKSEDNAFFGSKYFDINALLAAVKPVLNKHGLVLTQALTNLVNPMGGVVLALETKLTDVDSNESMSAICPLPQVDNPQKAGSAITYFRRYALQSLLGLEAEDDDANASSSAKPKAAVKETESFAKKAGDPSKIVSGPTKPVIEEKINPEDIPF